MVHQFVLNGALIAQNVRMPGVELEGFIRLSPAGKLPRNGGNRPLAEHLAIPEQLDYKMIVRFFREHGFQVLVGRVDHLDKLVYACFPSHIFQRVALFFYAFEVIAIVLPFAAVQLKQQRIGKVKRFIVSGMRLVY
ncbi:hypothetical protein SDC9_67584 [bioreactor metagenome]|uniref:Uncharacterized protein n=1 Tax=bioreactor metagenome TaxID=1076179 RepID=A0A644XZP9_9ZZZZ